MTTKTERQIRTLARSHELRAQKSRKDSRWYFANCNDYLQSPECGLTEEEAMEFLTDEGGAA